MEPERIPLVKVFDAPFLSLDGTSVEMASLLVLFLLVLVAAGVSRRRQFVRRVVQAVSMAVFFYVVYSCLGVFGMVRNAYHGVTLVGSVYSESFFWMALPVVAASVTLIAGPVFCGWICPTGTLQDIASAVRGLFPRVFKTKATRPRLVALGIVVGLFLAFLVWLSLEKKMFLEDSSLHWAAGVLMLCFLVVAGLVDDGPIRGLRLLSVVIILAAAVSRQIITSPTHFAFTSRADLASALSTAVIVIGSLLVTRAFCRYLCPWGYLMGALNRLARLKIVRVDHRCDGCNVCRKTCAVEAVDQGLVKTTQCQLCFSCIDHCPKSALELHDVWKKAPESAAKPTPQNEGARA